MKNVFITIMKWLNLRVLILISIGGVIFACQDNNSEKTYTNIAGIWRCEEIDPQNNIRVFNIDIESVKDYDNAFIVSNFHNVGEEYYIRLSVSNNQMVIPKQSLGLVLVAGQGEIESDYQRMLLEYSIDEDGITYTFYATCNR